MIARLWLSLFGAGWFSLLAAVRLCSTRGPRHQIAHLATLTDRRTCADSMLVSQPTVVETSAPMCRRVLTPKHHIQKVVRYADMDLNDRVVENVTQWLSQISAVTPGAYNRS